MDYYDQNEQSGGWLKKGLIIGAAVVLVIAIAVTAVLVRRRWAAAPSQPVAAPTVNVNGAVNAPPVVEAVVVDRPPGEMPKELLDLYKQDESKLPPLTPGEQRRLTTEEKRLRNFDEQRDIWMVTSPSVGGARPTVVFSDRTPATVRPADADGDSLSDAEEAQYRTDPRNPDTDGDDMGDYDEVKTYKTNPLNADTDGDGVKDHDEHELYEGDAPTNPCVPNPQFSGCKQPPAAPAPAPTTP